MVINSITFLLFFSAFFLLYWFVFCKKQSRLFLLLGASYLFYMWTDWRFLLLLIVISSLNFYLGLKIHKTENELKRKILLYIGLIQGIGGLIFFKYYNFFTNSFNETFQSIGLSVHIQTLSILVPLGISFFTFRTLSYILDIDKRKIEPVTNWLTFFNYVAFFPCLLSGPIDNAQKFIPQLEKEQTFEYTNAMKGLRQILWGLFKKIVIADSCASITDQIFENHTLYPASGLLLGAFLYTIQIYSDFSGYSDMVIGISRLLGFNITQNFSSPFFSQNIAEFWRKWHMSLTAWLTEYVFTPISTNLRDYGKYGLIVAIIINFTLCGIWHGPNWTYILFGFLHGCYFIPLIIKGTMNKKKKKLEHQFYPTISESYHMLKTFLLVMMTFIIFRAPNIGAAYDYYCHLFSISLFTFPEIPNGTENTIIIFCYIILMLIIEWKERERTFALEQFSLKWTRLRKLAFYYFILLSIVYFSGSEQKFIYLQF
jgi:alginate O-acetyltransferase complex protein AlgI